MVDGRTHPRFVKVYRKQVSLAGGREGKAFSQHIKANLPPLHLNARPSPVASVLPESVTIDVEGDADTQSEPEYAVEGQ